MVFLGDRVMGVDPDLGGHLEVVSLQPFLNGRDGAAEVVTDGGD
ncbi:MAG: hypothetical protein Q4D79_12885 [Propionibacteriaceae bacterium]|nr:hypothetical protein [Propionibacteriaceae bacterium]